MSELITLENIKTLVIVLVVLQIYALPSYLAYRWRHPQASMIVAINLFFSPLVAFPALFLMRPKRAQVSTDSRVRSCPSCGHRYDEADYSPTAPEWHCSRCGDLLPRAAA